MDQTLLDDPPVALVNFHITAAGSIEAKAVGVETEHLPLFIEELDRVREILQAKLPREQARVLRLA